PEVIGPKLQFVVSTSRSTIFDETQVLRTRRWSLPPDDLHRRAARPPLRRVRRHPLPGSERRRDPGGRDRDRPGVLPVLHVGQARPRRLGREDRRARRGPGAARDGGAALPDGRPPQPSHPPPPPPPPPPL